MSELPIYPTIDLFGHRSADIGLCQQTLINQHDTCSVPSSGGWYHVHDTAIYVFHSSEHECLMVADQRNNAALDFRPMGNGRSYTESPDPGHFRAVALYDQLGNPE